MKTYEKLCGVKNGYDRVTETILALRAAGISVKLNCSLTPDNAQDIEAIVRFAEAHRLNLSFASYMFPPIRLGEERMRSHRRFTPQEMARNTVRYIRCQMGESYADRYASEMVRRIRAVPETDAFCREREGDGVRCRAGRATFWATWEGNITPCGMMPIPSVPLSSGSFADAWRRLVEETAKIRLAPACAVCENKDICHVCAGMTYSETSDFTKRPEYLCGYVEALREELFKNEQNGGKTE